MTTTETTVATWFEQHLPTDLFEGTPTVTVDREEVVVVGAVVAVVSAAVGALILSRAVDDPALSDEILEATRKSLAEL